MAFNGNFPERVKLLILTVGHSTLPYEEFLALIRSAGINAIADVRSVPYSRHLPHFNKNALEKELKADGIAYVYLGEELGGRPKDSAFFCEGIADYEKMASSPVFAKALRRVTEGAKNYRIALMCTEQSPLDCHRCLLVGRSLKQNNVPVGHLLLTGAVISQEDVEKELLSLMGVDENQTDFFSSDASKLKDAYRLRANKVAFSDRPTDHVFATAAE